MSLPKLEDLLSLKDLDTLEKLSDAELEEILGPYFNVTHSDPKEVSKHKVAKTLDKETISKLTSVFGAELGNKMAEIANSAKKKK